MHQDRRNNDSAPENVSDRRRALPWRLRNGEHPIFTESIDFILNRRQ
jgi:hypothetical protein